MSVLTKFVKDLLSDNIWTSTGVNQCSQKYKGFRAQVSISAIKNIKGLIGGFPYKSANASI